MRAKIYERYYKRGFIYYLLKFKMGLKRPDKQIKRFYYILIVLIVIVGKVFFG